MRFHSRYPLLQFWSGERLRLVRAEKLSVARLEPVVGDTVIGGGILDLVFSEGENIAAVPFVRVEPYALVQRERTPIVWPAAMRGIGYDALLEIEREVLPWLQSLALARQQNAEVIRTFGTAGARRTFDAARAAGFAGAARYDELLPAFAPYVYAVRFGSGRSIGIVDPSGANGAAMLARCAKSVRADLRSAENNELATTWFGTPIFGEVSGTFDVVAAPQGAPLDASETRITLDAEEERSLVVPVASAVPLDVLVSFDPEDAPVARMFSVHSKIPVQLRTVASEPIAPAAGGSSGTILMLMREDFERAPDADVDEARDLASRLRAEGFSVDLRAPAAVHDGYRPDLVHAFTLDDASVDRALARMRAAGVPIVANSNIGPAPQEAAWGPDVLSAVYSRAGDDGMLAELLDLIGLRKLSTEQSTPAPSTVPALQHVDVAIVAADAEQQLLRDVLGFRGETVRYAPRCSGDLRSTADISTLVGNRPFALVHAAVDWRTNLPALATAAARHDVPLVVAGPLVNFACLRYAAQPAPELLVHVPKPDAAELDALYRAARLYADVSWGPRGLGRLARAAASGCRLLVSRSSFAGAVWPAAAAADPASPESISAALQDAWNATDAPPPAAGPDLFSAAIFAYSKAVAARRPA